MRFDIMTLFPEMVDMVLNTSVIGNARKNNIFDIYTHNIRDYSLDKHKRVDDILYGGGKGMLMAPQPIYDCYKSIEKDLNKKPHVIYVSPKGEKFTQNKARELLEYENITILCGHYEGIDQRVIDKIVDEEISIGDFVVSGGEIPACIIVDAVCRMIPGTLTDDSCFENESIYSGLLEEEQYTHPEVWEGMAVPPVLLSGNHKEIEKYRLKRAIEITKERRPDLLK